MKTNPTPIPFKVKSPKSPKLKEQLNVSECQFHYIYGIWQTPI